jgi:energy-coupling factor transporter ATP-binding protein EcfA2
MGTMQCKMRNDRLRRLGFAKVAMGNDYFECNGGSLLYLLGALQVVALEERLSFLDPSKAHYVTISVETYGNKASSAAFLSDLSGSTPEDKADEIIRLLDLNTNGSINIIQRFSAYCAQTLGVKDPNSNNLYLGVGATCHGFLKNEGRPLWSAFPLSALRRYLSNDNDTLKYCTDTVPPSILEGYCIPEKGLTNISLQDWFDNMFKIYSYPINAGIVPSDSQPYTAIMCDKDLQTMSASHENDSFLMKLQHYSVNAREAIGETGKWHDYSKLTAIVALCLKAFSITTDINPLDNTATKVYRNDHHTEHLNNVFEHLKVNSEVTRESGNTSRMEITCKSMRFNRHHLSLRQAFVELLGIVDNVSQYYDIAEPVATCTEFFAHGLRARSDFAVSQLRESNTSTEAIEQMLTYIVEEIGHWQSFYSGRKTFSAKAKICKRFAIAASRPILAALDTKLISQLERMNFQPLLLWFLGQTGVSCAPSVDLCLSSSTQFERLLVIKGLACKHCGSLIHDKSRLGHPCTQPDITEYDLVSVASPEFIGIVAKWYLELSDHQKHFVDVVSNDVKRNRRYFLTGFAGCGKTRTLNCLISRLISKVGIFRVVAISYTKAAANEVHGESIHSLFNLQTANLNKITVEDAVAMLNQDERKIEILQNLHTLIIDEVSLLTGVGLDLIDGVLRSVRGYPKRPFGGAQIVLCGDCLQLPPIMATDDSNYSRRFFFQANAWFKSGFRVCYLHHIFRQTSMTSLLNCIRDGEISDQQLELLNQRCGEGVSRYLVEFLIDQMAILNGNEATTTDKAEKKKMKIKVNNYYLDSRCGGYAAYGAFTTVTSKSAIVRDELDKRPLLRDGKNSFDLAKAMKTTFIVGVENCESNQFSKAMEELINNAPAMKDILIQVDAKDTFYDYQATTFCSINETQANEVANLLESGSTTISNGQLSKYYVPSVVTHSYDKTKVEWHENWNNCPKLVRSQKMFLYVGQSVIFTSNRIDKLVANNSQGIIEEIVLDEETQQVKMLVIKPVCNKGLHIPSIKVRRDRKVIGKQGFAVNRSNNYTQYHFAVREQFPIKPAVRVR